MNRSLAVAVLAALCLAPTAWSQDPPKAERKLAFNFKDASADAVLQYVCRAMSWTLVYGVPKPDSTITAWSDAEVPEARIQDFLNSALAKVKVQVFMYGGVLKVVGEEDAKKGTFNIDYGDDPEKVPVNDTVRTWIMPLKNAKVADVKKELEDVLKADSLTTVINAYSNTVIMSGKGSSIYRVVRILKIIDVEAAERLEVKMFHLKHADAAETARLIGELFKQDAGGANARQGGGLFAEMGRAFGFGRRNEGGGDDQKPAAKTLASEVLRLTADMRTNSVVVTTTIENMKLIETVITDLDRETGDSVRLKLYPLRYADAKEVAGVIMQIFTDEAAQNRQAQRNQMRNQPFAAGAQVDSGGASREVRAVAELRSNSVIVAANEANLKIIDDLVLNLDRQLTDVLRIKVYELQNSSASTMANILRDVFRPQINATQASGRSTGGGGQQGGGFGQFFRMMGGGQQPAQSSGGLPPSQEVAITADTRTNSVIVKASEDYIKVCDQVVNQLDQNPTESQSTYVVQLDNADAATLADTLRNLLRGGGGSNRGQVAGVGSASNRNMGSRTTRRLGPLDDNSPDSKGEARDSAQEEPGLVLDSQEDEDDEWRRGIEGQVDVQADAQTNSLVIRTTPRNYDSIRNIIRGLDRMRPQVLIKVLIADVTLDREFKFGVEWNWENKFHVNGESITQKYATAFGLFNQGAKATFTGDEFSAALNAFAEDGRLKVLATPRILVLDNQQASISIGKDVPRVTNTTINQQGNVVNTVQYRSVGILLDVTPHINFDGLVTMIVHPEVSEAAGASESVQITQGVTSPTFNVNYADTVVAARSGQTVVIGGLIRESDDDTVTKVPILGDIPLIGALFSNTTRSKVRRELMIFLTPYVAYTSAQLEEVADLEKAQLKLMDYRDAQDEADQWLKLRKRP